MWTRALLKENGKIAFQRNYWTCVAVCVIASLLGGTTVGGLKLNFNDFNTESASGVYDINAFDKYLRGISWQILTVFMMAAIIGIALSFCLTILVSNVIEVGNSRYFLENREHKTGVGKLFYSFQSGRYPGTVWVMFLRALFITLWSLLFLIPGIVKSYSYKLVPYILAENTYLDRKRVFELSSEMMRGHKMEAFVLELSFFGWYLLGALTAGIVNIFYVAPYVNATFAEFYSAIKEEARMKGIFAPGELPGVRLPEEA